MLAGVAALRSVHHSELLGKLRAAPKCNGSQKTDAQAPGFASCYECHFSDNAKRRMLQDVINQLLRPSQAHADPPEADSCQHAFTRYVAKQPTDSARQSVFSALNGTVLLVRQIIRPDPLGSGG